MKKIFSFRCQDAVTKKHLHFSISAKDIKNAYDIIEKKHKNIIVLEYIGWTEAKTPEKKTTI